MTLRKLIDHGALDTPFRERREALQLGFKLAGLLTLAGVSPFATAAYNKAAFDAKSIAEAVKAQAAGTLAESKDVVLTAPDYAENGASVALSVSTALNGVKKILLLIEKNPAVLAASFQVSDNIDASLTIRAKMSQTSDVYAVALMADGKVLFTKKEVKVTLGGCG